MKEVRPRLKGKLLKAHSNLTKDESRVLVVGDLHEPFCLDEYLEFNQELYYKYNINRIIFIGDIIDNHYSSYHETDADGLGGADELELATERIQRWYEVFPKADVLYGNHDIMVSRKAQTSNVPSKWIKSLQEVLEVPGWTFHEELEVDDVLYIHGIGKKAHIRARNNMQSTVQGHHHTEAYVHWLVGSRDKVFGMQVGCGIDKRSYAMAYGKWFDKPVISSGIVIGGHTAFNAMMNL